MTARNPEELKKQAQQKMLSKGKFQGDDISVGLTWVDGRILFKPDTKYAQFYYGICHMSKAIAFITPLDYQDVTMQFTGFDVIPYYINTAEASGCEKAKICLHFKCPFNRWTREDYLTEFGDMGALTLGLPGSLNRETPIWFNEPPYLNKWQGFILPITGGRLDFNETQAELDGKI